MTARGSLWPDMMRRWQRARPGLPAPTMPATPDDPPPSEAPADLGMIAGMVPGEGVRARFAVD